MPIINLALPKATFLFIRAWDWQYTVPFTGPVLESACVLDGLMGHSALC